MPIIYLSGPMSGIPDYNHQEFNAAAERLRGFGLTVINPAEQPEQGTWIDYMRHDIKLLLDAHVVAVLPGWEKSTGAKLEVAIARELGMPVLMANEVHQGRLPDLGEVA